ncbi:sulfotransferase family 2 domain-containing protein [Namhaeicola litoreus]|uniref:Sulfotransferase family 2 domain-containing protein n=1 Tax=Namhaeicola litoreus TaxID=1052145 RepID=A0ABW3XYM5_9FLAO
MLISDTHEFIFVHVRKSAGGSINETLKSISIPRPDDLISKVRTKLGWEKDYHHYRFRQHATLLNAKKVIPKEVFDKYFKFAFVRNPYTRLVSEYEYIRRTKDHGRNKRVMRMTFDQYITFQAARYNGHQVNMLVDKKGKLLSDFVGKMENLDEDWKVVCEKLKIPFNELPHNKKAKKINYAEYYNEHNLELVAKLWAKDFETFGYPTTFEL